jgi:hypothetical protein
MRIGLLEVVVKAQHAQVKETKIDDKIYIGSKDGKEFTIDIKIHRDENGNFPFATGSLRLFIDGVKVCSHNMRLEEYFGEHPFAFKTIVGYKHGSKSFVFGTVPINLANASGSVENSVNIGVITVQLFESHIPKANILKDNTNLKRNIKESITHSEIQTADETKKFWLVPSLSTVSGRNLGALTFKKSLYKAVDETAPFETVILHYHTKEMIKCLKMIYAQNQEEVNGNNTSLTSDDVVHAINIINSNYFANELKSEEPLLHNHNILSSSSSSSSSAAATNTNNNTNIDSNHNILSTTRETYNSDSDIEDVTSYKKKKVELVDLLHTLGGEEGVVVSRGYTKQHDGSVVDLCGDDEE